VCSCGGFTLEGAFVGGGAVLKEGFVWEVGGAFDSRRAGEGGGVPVKEVFSDGGASLKERGPVDVPLLARRLQSRTATFGVFFFCGGRVFFEVGGTNSGASFRPQKTGPLRSDGAVRRCSPVPFWGPGNGPKIGARRAENLGHLHVLWLAASFLGLLSGPKTGTGKVRTYPA
jgi:hypothetical protein